MSLFIILLSLNPYTSCLQKNSGELPVSKFEVKHRMRDFTLAERIPVILDNRYDRLTDSGIDILSNVEIPYKFSVIY